MAEVYLAIDQRLERPVALKFLNGDSARNAATRESLQREARAVSKLDHPNICTIYEYDVAETLLEDDGIPFIAMAYYQGETLSARIRRGRLPLDEALSLMAQVARGLAMAHRHGIVHGDIKPGNIMITEDGQAKILDFGIARASSAFPHTVGSIYGTVSYMSPEQCLSSEIDGRSDLWSLGVVLYQAVSGMHPYVDGDPMAVVNQIVGQDWRLPNLPQRDLDVLAPLLEKAMAKRVPDRYRDGTEMARALEAAGYRERPKPSDRPSIAILPFKDLSPDQDQGHFCLGLAEELIYRLTNIGGVHVAARTSTAKMAKWEGDHVELGRELGADLLLEGTVYRVAQRLRVSARLIKVRSGRYEWSEIYDRDPEGLFEIQEELAQKIALSLEVTVMGTPKTSRTAQGEVVPLTAYNLYLKGRYCWSQRTEEAFLESIEYYWQAIGEEPGYARAYAGIADSYTMLGVYGARPPQDVMPEAKAAADKALSLDESLSQVVATQATIRAVFDWDFDEAQRDFHRSIRMDPDDATSYQWYAMHHLVPLGRFQEAFEQLHRALDLDPRSIAVQTSLGLCHSYARRPEEAIEMFRKVLKIGPGFLRLRAFLSYALMALDRFEDAEEELSQAGRADPEILVARARLAALQGAPARARDMLDDLHRLATQRYISRTLPARVLLALGEPEAALDELQEASVNKAADLVWLNVDPAYSPLRDQPRYQALLRKIGLVINPSHTTMPLATLLEEALERTSDDETEKMPR